MNTTDELFAQAVPTPLRLDGKLLCPRCRSWLLFDGDELLCVLCGYEHETAAAYQQAGYPR